MRALLDWGTIRTDTIVAPGGIQLNNFRLKHALNLILDPHDLAYVVRNEMLYITTQERARRRENTYTRIYYVGDIDGEYLSERRDNFEKTIEATRDRVSNSKCCPGCPCSAQRSDANPVPSGGTGGMGGGMGCGMMGGGGFICVWCGGQNSPWIHSFHHHMLAPFSFFGSILGIIQSVIEPESWRDMMLGGEGVIEFHYPTQSLIIRNTEDVHAQIEALLNAIREVNLMIEMAPQ